MDFEQELKKVAGSYSRQGYEVVVRPRPEQLPPFARDFKIEILARRAAEGVIVAVKKNRNEMAADANLPGYAEIIGAQPGWRFDFVILEAEQPGIREVGGSKEFSGEDIDGALAGAEQMVRQGFIPAAVVIAWSALEAAMRMRLRADGEQAGWGTMPREMMNELYSSGVFSVEEFSQLEKLSRVRNQIVHGFASPASDASLVQFLSGLARRLVEESLSAKQTA